MEQQRQGPKGQTLSMEDLVEAELAIIQYCQQQRFAGEIAALGSGKDTVSKQSSIYKWDPYLYNGLESWRTAD